VGEWVKWRLGKGLFGEGHSGQSETNSGPRVLAFLKLSKDYSYLSTFKTKVFILIKHYGMVCTC
jgi:hypothetical protein